MKAQLKVLILLFLLLLGIAIYAFPSWDERLKTALSEVAGNEVVQTSDSAMHAPIDTTAQRILLIGDSMNEGIARRFSAWCECSGHELHTVIWYGSSTESWAKNDGIANYVRKTSPTYVIVSLGSNELFVKDVQQRAAYVRKIIESIGKTPFVWIGPPNWKKDTGINDLIACQVGPTRFYESRRLTLERGSDHRHPTLAAAAVWTDSIAAWLTSDQTAHPIRFAKPTAPNGQWRKRLTLLPQE